MHAASQIEPQTLALHSHHRRIRPSIHLNKHGAAAACTGSQRAAATAGREVPGRHGCPTKPKDGEPDDDKRKSLAPRSLLVRSLRTQLPRPCQWNRPRHLLVVHLYLRSGMADRQIGIAGMQVCRDTAKATAGSG